MRLACSDDSIAEENYETILALQSMHPVAYLDSAMPSPPPSVGDVEASLSVSVDAITKAISSFPRGSAGGPDGLLPQHLHDLTHWSAGAGGSSLLHALMAFSNLETP